MKKILISIKKFLFGYKAVVEVCPFCSSKRIAIIDSFSVRRSSECVREESYLKCMDCNSLCRSQEVWNKDVNF